MKPFLRRLFSGDCVTSRATRRRWLNRPANPIRLELLEVRALMSTVGLEDFDGGEVNLISDTVVNRDGGAGDFFGVGNTGAWPQGFPPGIPFSLVDDSVVSVSNPANAPFAADSEGIYGQNSDFSNDFFALSDTREWTAAQRTVTWTFDIAGVENLGLSIDMGGISDAASGGYSATTDIKFLVQIDGGPSATAFDLNAIALPVGFTTRPMDDGDASGGGRVLEVTGPSGVIKRLAEDGSVASNTYLDKAPAAGPGAGRLDTYSTAIAGTGSTLTLTMIADVPFEAMAFDNITITGDPFAFEDFDGGEVNLTSDTVVNRDGGAGDFFGVGNTGAWPQGFPPGVPFSLVDDSVVSVSNPANAPFAADGEGIYGQNSDFNNDFFALSDTREWTAAQRTVTWTFDITGIANPLLSIDMGGISDAASGGYSATTDVKFLVQIDGGAVETAFDLDAISLPAGFTTRPMDDGDASGGGRVLVVTGPNGVIKRLAEDGSVASNTYLDKTPAAGPGAGKLDSYTTSLNSGGSTLVLTMMADVPFEAMAFDNILIKTGAAADTTPPGVASLSPADEAANVAVDANLIIGFNELVQMGAGSITVFNASDDSVVEVVDISAAMFGGAGVTIDLTADLDFSTTYYVNISAGAVQDLAGNDFAGILDETTWNFTTVEPPDVTPPAFVDVGPFSVSENQVGGAVVGDVNADDGDGADVGVRYAFVTGSGADASMMVGAAGYAVTPLFTVGQTVPSTGALNSTSAGDYSPIGVLDGIGAYELDGNTVRVFVNHEVGPGVGQPYMLENGLTLGGARISYFDIDKTSRTIVDSGLAYGTVYNRAGELVSNVSQLDTAGFDRFCSAALFEPHQFGADRGIVDRIFFSGEEASTEFGHPFGGTQWALDPATGELWALPDFGRGSWENVTQIDTGTTTHVAFLMGDDAEGRPLWMYVGEKNPAGNFIERNGLAGGKLYYWKSNTGEINADSFNATENGDMASLDGTWVEFTAKVPAMAGTPGYDSQGYKNDVLTLQDVVAGGGFQFSRPEDVSTNPADGTEVVFASTGRAAFANDADRVGTVYRINVDLSNLSAPTAQVTILYDGDADPNQVLRSPDNLDWADDGYVYVQEDDAVAGLFGGTAVNQNEASIVRLDPNTGEVKRIAEIDRTHILPLGTADTSATDVGNWESSGILDVSTLFGEAPGTLFLFDVQAHSIRGGVITANNLDQGGQLSLMEVGGEAGAFRINRNTGVVTVANPDALKKAEGPFQLTVQAIDAGGNTSFETLIVNVNEDPVAAETDVRFATYNASLNRNTLGELVADLSTPNNAQARQVAEIIQRTSPDVVLINEFDFVANGLAADLFRENYLELSQNGQAPVYYPYVYLAPSNTGIPTGFDLDNNGVVGGPEDAYGFGEFAGQFAMVLFSKYEIVSDQVRTFQTFRWEDMPGALLPDNPATPEPADWYSPAELDVFRLSSKSHWDVPINVNGTVIHALTAHPTPPVFDDPPAFPAGVDHNGRRNHDEIRFWDAYITPGAGDYIYDDGGAFGGLSPAASFVIMGDHNSDPFDGDSIAGSAQQIINNPNVNNTVTPSSAGGVQNADAGHIGNPAFDTSDFGNPPGNLRVDYVLPSLNLEILDAAVFWPQAGEPGASLVAASDHRLVYVDLALPASAAPRIAEDRKSVTEIEFIDEVTFPTGLQFDGTTVGGLSGISYDAATGLYYSLSDDRANARFYTLTIAPDFSSVAFTDVTTLTDAGGVPFAALSLDPEGIALTDNGTLIITSEGDVTQDIDPFVNEFNLGGMQIGELPVPAKFLVDSGVHGIRNNLAFESATITPDGRFLFVATENALIQDGPAATLDDESPARIIKYDLTTGQVVAEYAYYTDPVADEPIPAGSFSTNGLVELLAIDNEGTLLALERSFSVGVGNAVKLYEVLTTGSVDIRSFGSIDGLEPDPAAEKRELFDFADLGLTLDNLEGMTFGPDLADGRKSLVVVSDNNFSATQFTQFLSFAVDLRTIYAVHPTVETPAGLDGVDPLPADRFEADADDPAIYVHPTDPSQSIVLGTLKDGGLQVYDLGGAILQHIDPDGIRYNNVDLLYGVNLGNGPVDIAVVSDRENDTVAAFQIDPTARQLTDITGNVPASIFGVDDGEATAYGLVTYRSPKTGKLFAFVTQSDGNHVAQLELTSNGAGGVDASVVRMIDLPVDEDVEDALAEGLVVDQEYGALYVAQEDGAGILKFDAEPTGSNSFTVVAGPDSIFLVPDLEGLTIYYGSDGNGFLLASSQGDSSFAIFDREGDNPYLGSFFVGENLGVDDSDDSDGLDVTSVPLGPAFPMGALIVQDGSDNPQFTNVDDTDVENAARNFKFVPWQNVVSGLPDGVLFTDTGFDPRNPVNRTTNVINGTNRPDNIVGTDAYDIITGGIGGDTILDFQAGQDRIQLTGILGSLGLSAQQLIDQGYIRTSSRGAYSFLEIKLNGNANPNARGLRIAAFLGVAESDLLRAENFVI